MKSQHRKLSLLVGGILLFQSSMMYAADKRFIQDLPQAIHKSSTLESALGLSPSYHFKSTKEVALSPNIKKYKLTQYFMKVPIWNASIVTTLDKNGEYKDIFGSYITGIEKDLFSAAPKLSTNDAFDIAFKNFKHDLNSTVANKQANLYIVLDKNNKASLVYLVSFFVDGHTPKRPYAMIDANSGNVLRTWDGLTTKDGFGPGGNTKTGKYYYGKDYPPMIVTATCQMDAPNVATYNLQNKTGGGVLYEFQCPENTYKFTNGAYSPLNDAHYFGNVVFNMYKQWFNAAPLKFKLKMLVHYGNNYENAFWDGQQMTFGDGASYFFPLVSLDVSAHEVSHGFTEQNSGLVYQYQPGGINESFSDIAGEAAKYFNNPNKPQNERNDWLVGAQIMKSDSALRYFKDPTLDGRSIGNANDYTDNLDVHYSSGVFNKAFYTLATKSNWNTEKAFRAFVLANQMYWNEESDYINAACGVNKAAKDLSYSTQDVIDAFKAVGVDATCAAPPADIELKNGEPVNNLSGAAASKVFYTVNVPAGTSSLLVKIYNGNGDADLYVKYNSKPSTSSYDCRPYLTGNNESCSLKVRSTGGKYFVMIQGYKSYSGLSVEASY